MPNSPTTALRAAGQADSIFSEVRREPSIEPQPNVPAPVDAQHDRQGIDEDWAVGQTGVDDLGTRHASAAQWRPPEDVVAGYLNRVYPSPSEPIQPNRSREHQEQTSNQRARRCNGNTADHATEEQDPAHDCPTLVLSAR